MENPTTPTTDFETTRTNAEAVLARKLASHTIGGEGNQQFLDGAVTINTGIENDGYYGAEQQFYDQLTFTIEGNSVDQQPNEVRKAIEKALHDIPHIDELVRTGSLKDEVQDVEAALTKLKDAGANIPDSIFKWAGFDKENEQKDEVNDYMVSVAANSHGVHVGFNLPEHLPSGMSSDDITTHIKVNESKIKDELAHELVKANGGDKTEIREQLDALEFVIRDYGENVKGDHVGTGRMEIDIVSPQQKQAKEAAGDKAFEPPKADPELEKTNPLQALDALALSKAVSKSIQKGSGEKAGDIIPVILGAKDVMRKIEKALEPFKKEHPELEHEVAEVLNSNIFDRSNPWDKDPNAKFQKKGIDFRTSINKPEDNPKHRNRMTVTITVPEGKASEIIQQLSDMDPAAAQQQATQQQMQRFEKLEKVQVIGGYSSDPEIHAQMQTMLAPLVGQTFTPAQATDKLQPAVDKIVELIESMHQAKESATDVRTDKAAIPGLMQAVLDQIDEAHKTITEGVQLGAQQAQTPLAQAAPAPCQAQNPCQAMVAPHPEKNACNSISEPSQGKNACNSMSSPCQAHAQQDTKNTLAETPSPVVTPSWIQQLVVKTQNKGGMALGA